MFRKRYIALALLIILAALIGFYFDLLTYGINQAKGQLKIVREARPNEAWLSDPHYPDSLKRKIKLVDEIRRFAFDSLGINYSENYTTMYDQQGKPLMFVVTACPPFKLEAVEFKFPILGSFTYKGFFDEKKAIELADQLKSEGYDTNIRTASGWSTLGWFKDPILSEMLTRSDGYLAETIIHELTHGTLFVKDSLKFNENLATFIGSHGARIFLENRFGGASNEYIQYIDHWEDRKLYRNHILRGAQHLDSLYTTFDADMTDEAKAEMKNKAIEVIIDAVDTLALADKERYKTYLAEREINNTFFMSYIRYHGDIELLEEELRNQYGGNIKKMLESYKAKFPSL